MNGKNFYRLSEGGFLLSFEDADAGIVYPSFQFPDGLLDVRYACLSVLLKEVDGWAVYNWFLSPVGLLGGDSPVEWLTAGSGLDAVVEWAELFVDKWFET